MREQLILMNRNCGEIDYENNLYISHRNRNHFFHKFGEGFGLSNSILDFLIEEKIEIVIIIFENTKFYYSSVSNILLNAKEWNDNGYLQLILPIDFWKEWRDEIKI